MCSRVTLYNPFIATAYWLHNLIYVFNNTDVDVNDFIDVEDFINDLIIDEINDQINIQFRQPSYFEC